MALITLVKANQGEITDEDLSLQEALQQMNLFVDIIAVDHSNYDWSRPSVILFLEKEQVANNSAFLAQVAEVAERIRKSRLEVHHVSEARQLSHSKIFGYLYPNWRPAFASLREEDRT